MWIDLRREFVHLPVSFPLRNISDYSQHDEGSAYWFTGSLIMATDKGPLTRVLVDVVGVARDMSLYDTFVLIFVVLPPHNGLI